MASTILLAEDDPFNLKLLEEVCLASSYHVLSAVDGAQVLDIVAREKPDLVLLDVNMPVLNGFEVLQILKSDPVMASIPVLMMTAVDDTAAKQKGIELGAEDYITKPYRVFEVQQRIKNTLRRLSVGSQDKSEIDTIQSTSQSVTLTTDIRALLSSSNPHQLFIALNYEFTRAMRYGHSFSCLVMQHVGLAPDNLEPGQTSLAPWFMPAYRAIKASIRSTDHLFRNRPRELVVLLPETDLQGTDVVAQRIWELIEADPAIDDVEAFKYRSATYPTPTIGSGSALLHAALNAEQKIFPQNK